MRFSAILLALVVSGYLQGSEPGHTGHDHQQMSGMGHQGEDTAFEKAGSSTKDSMHSDTSSMADEAGMVGSAEKMPGMMQRHDAESPPMGMRSMEQGMDGSTGQAAGNMHEGMEHGEHDHSEMMGTAQDEVGETALEHALKHQDPNYVCPMHPNIISDQPGHCPICGMDLEPVAVVSAGEGEVPSVTVGAEMVQALGFRSVEVKKRDLSRMINTIGYVEYDRDRLEKVFAPSDGYIENLSIVSEGERVKKGQLLFSISTPTLSAYFDKTYAEIGGIVSELNVLEGDFVRAEMPVATLADLSSVWILAEVFENEAPWVKEGQMAMVRLPSVPDRVWSGKVEYIYPNLDPVTRTLKVRMRFDNPGEVLKPNMYAEIMLHSGTVEDVVAIPREALIETGKQQRVIIAKEGNRFQSRHVTVGTERGDWVEITKGLKSGEQVVVSGQFLIDSEANLRANLQRMLGSAGHH